MTFAWPKDPTTPVALFRFSIENSVRAAHGKAVIVAELARRSASVPLCAMRVGEQGDF